MPAVIRHRATGGYFGHVSHGKSAVFVFRDPRLARVVARGLENHRAVTGHFPPPEQSQIDLSSDGSLHSFEHLDVSSVNVDNIMRTTKGSGVSVVLLGGDEPSAELCAGVELEWLEKQYLSSSEKTTLAASLLGLVQVIVRRILGHEKI